jgi:hypothetical protein
MKLPPGFFNATILLLLPLYSAAQLHWKKVTNVFDSLPSSIRVFSSHDSLNGRPCIAWCVEIKLKDKKLHFTTQTGKGKRYTPSQYYEANGKPYIVVNGGYFSFQTNQNLSAVIRDGKLEAYNVPALKSLYTDSFYYPTRGAIGIHKNRWADVAWLFTDSSKRWPYAFQERPIVAKGSSTKPGIDDLRTIDRWKFWKMQTAIGGGPVLVREGAIMITNKEEQLYMRDDEDRHPRTAMGYTQNRRLIILVIQGRTPGIAEGATIEETAKLMLELGCEEALNLDGGGSSCLLINGRETIVPSDKEGQRPVSSVFIVQRNEK